MSVSTLELTFLSLFVYVLSLAVFAQGTSEFMLSGLVPDIARDMSVSVGASASLTSAYAIGMVIGAPVMAALSARWPRRWALATFLIAFVTVHVIGAVTGDFAVLFGTPITLFLITIVQGGLSFGVGSALVTRVLHVAPKAPSLAGSFATVALNIGAVLVPLLAGIITGATGDYRYAVWLSTALAATAAITLAGSGMRTRRRDSVQAR